MSLKETGLTGEQAKRMNSEEMKTLPQIREKLAESKTKLDAYHKSLLLKYGSLVRLRSYSVAAIGFERLIWEQLE